MALTKNIYSLPFKKKDLIAAVSHPRAHFTYLKHAIDFVLPEGTTLFAPKSGTVYLVKVDSNEGGMAPKYNDVKYLNYLSIKHSNGEYSVFAHLKHNGALVKQGDKVNAGQPIAISGNTGFTTTPHLHFQVAKYNKTIIGGETLEVRFNEKVYVDRINHRIPKEQKETIKECDRVRKMLKSK